MSKSDNTQINGEKDIALNLTVALYVYFRSNENNNMRNISHFNDSLCRFQSKNAMKLLLLVLNTDNIEAKNKYSFNVQQI